MSTLEDDEQREVVPRRVEAERLPKLRHPLSPASVAIRSR